MRFKTNFFLVLLLIISLNPPLFPDKIVEKLSITGYLFSEVSPSKNLEIITQKDILELNIGSFSELFSFLTSINVSRRGASDTSLDFSLRGSNFEQVLIMINGIPFNNPQSGHFNGDFPFSVRDIKRIEILKGGNSAIYGGGAFAGIINIILNHQDSLSFSVTGGEHDYLSAYLSTGRRFADLMVKFSARGGSTSGFYSGREYDLINLFTNACYNKRSMSFNFSAGYLFKNFGARGFYAPFPSKEKIKSAIFQIQAKKTTKKVDYILKLAHDFHEDYFVLDRTRPDFYSNQSDTVNLLGHLSVRYSSGRFQTHAGGEVKKEILESSGMGNHARTIPAVFFKLGYSIDQGGLDLGLRADFSNQNDSSVTYYGGCHYSLNPRLKIKLGLGKSYRLPSFTEMYYNSPSNRGDPGLKPETGYNLEGVFSCYIRHQSLSFTFFYRSQARLIDWVKTPPSEIWQAVNLPENNLYGFEFSHQITLNSTRMAYTVERIFSRNLLPGILSKYGLRFPDISLKINLLQRLGKNVRITAGYCFKRIYNTSEQAHYLNLSLSCRIHERMEINLKADNLLNSIMEEIPGVKVPGRWIYLTLTYH